MGVTPLGDLNTWLVSTTLTRATILQGLAASAAALAGTTLRAQQHAAGKNDRKRKRQRARTLCVCQNADAATCAPRTLSRRARKRLLGTNPCAYPGPCQAGVTGCPVPLVPDPGPGPGPSPGPSPGAACTSNQQCTGQLCVGGRCRGGEACDPSLGECPELLDCIPDAAGAHRCLIPDQGFGECAPVDDARDCTENGGETADRSCVLGACLIGCPSDACEAFNGDCVAGICLAF